MASPRTTRTEQAYRHLLDEVLRGRWQAGDTLSTYALAEELNISRTPVMEALKRLEGDGLVEIIPQVGCRVVRPSVDSVEELFGLRGALEGLAAAAASRRLDREELAELDATLPRMEHAARDGDRVAYDELTDHFHMLLVNGSRMPRLIQAARGVRTALRYQLAGLPVGSDQLRESIPEHRELYEALRRRAPKRARAAAERHARLSATRFVAVQEPSSVDRLVHRALVYAGQEDFLATTVPFVEEGLSAGERVLAVTTPVNGEALARALGRQGDEVEFRDSDDWYQLPSHTMLSYERYMENADSSRVRVIGEVAWDGDSLAPMSEWTRYESMINVAFALEPITFICPYDAGRLPDRIVADASRTHPELCAGETSWPSPDYTDVAALTRRLDAEGFPEPEAPTRERSITADLRLVREFILDEAHRAGISGKAVQDAFLAVQEVAANVITRGPGHGTIKAWTQAGDLIYEVRDEGTSGSDLPQLAWDPTLMSEPRGLWMARLLCDLVEIRSNEGGLVVRLHVSTS